MRRGVGVIACACAALAAIGLTRPSTPADADAVPDCAPGGPVVTMTGEVAPSDAKTYRELPFDVQAGTTRVEVGYAWADKTVGPIGVPSTPLTQTVFDLGLWDEDGPGTVAGFRGWSGSRQGKIGDDPPQPPIWVQADSAERGYRPGTVEPGRWTVDLGVAAVGPVGATWRVEVRCSADAVGAEPVPQPVDATHVADPAPGWYHGDFHMHGYHSNARAPSWPRFVEFARAAGLDFLPVTDYVTNQHHDELGPIQAANPDLVIWPGREIITYFGHANALGETPSVIDWRHGHNGVTLREIQADTVADGALFQVNHPTIFPGPIFSNFCRGCEFELRDEIDWDAVDTIEVLTGPILVDSGDIGAPELPLQIQNPFVESAIDLWEQQLLEGHRITAVSGSDDKLGPGLGSSATAVYARELSRPALIEAVRAGHAYVRTRGVHNSPSLELWATTADGQRGTFGDTFDAKKATVDVRIRGAKGQMLRVTRDGVVTKLLPITSDDWRRTFHPSTSPLAGPLGSFWRIDTLDARSLTTIANPIFLAG